MEKLIPINFPHRDSLRTSSEVLQRYAARKLDTLHFSFRSTIELVKLAALLYRAYNEASESVWLCPWQKRALWLALYRERKEWWFVVQYAAEIYEQRPDWSLKYPIV